MVESDVYEVVTLFYNLSDYNVFVILFEEFVGFEKSSIGLMSSNRSKEAELFPLLKTAHGNWDIGDYD